MLKANSFLDVLKHLAIMAVLGALLLLGFFFFYLPNTTNHGETISVPDVVGMQMAELEDFLDDRSLKYYIHDSTYNLDKKPFVVLTQYPPKGSKVKEGRKIYVTINMKNPPKIKMPKLIDGSVKNAQMILKSYDLRLGQITYVPDLQQNAVLKQIINGKEVAPGSEIAKGSTVDLVVGDGLGNAEFETPNIVGMPADEASVLLAGQGLQLGNIIYTPNSGQPDGVVIRQRPVAGQGSLIRAGAIVDIWVSGTEPAAIE
ncbi:MAG: PASTA domain-containing protein [Sphingobacteriales bacterium]|nr:MAG: PASTA domain-containing protein [Sphingobacteriales bacterium]